MESCILLSLVYATTVCPLYSAAVPQFFRAPQDPESIQRAVEIYNAEQITGFLYKPLPVHPRHSPADPVSISVLTFLIKETVCSKSKQQIIGDCPFKEDGEVKNCTVSIDGSEDVAVECDALTDANEVSANYPKNESGKPIISKKLARLVKRRSLSLTSTKTVNGSLFDSSQASFSCLQCILDLLG